MSLDLPRYVTPALNAPWAIDPDYGRIVVDVLARRIAGVPSDPEIVAAAKAARRDPQPSRGGVAIIPIHGMLAPRANMLNDVSGATSYDKVASAIRAAVRHPEVRTILLDVDSPGGSVVGATELAAVIRAARAEKAVIAQGNFDIGSAAYWIAAQATKVHLSPSSRAGAIGVYTLHEDLSEALAKLGIKREYIAAGKFKVEGNETSALSDEARAYTQMTIAEHYDRFLGDVARGRGVSAAQVRSDFGEGRMLTADAALAAGLCDKISTFDDTLERLTPAGTSSYEDLAALSGVRDISQEPSPATDQGCVPDAAWQARVERDLFALSLS